MKEFEDICREYQKEPIEVERDLFRTLQNIDLQANVKALNVQYYYARINFLFLNGFILRGNKNEITPTGRFALKRGWVYLNIKEYKKQKRRELWSRITPNMLQVISILVAIALGVLGLFYPRQDSPDSGSKIKDIVPHIEENIINTHAQVDEVSQQTDSTEQQNDSCKSK